MRDDSPRRGCRRTDLATDSRTVHVGRCHPDLRAPESSAGRDRRDIRGIAADDQPTTGLIGRALRSYVPTADELDDRTQYVVDGTLLPCWSWAAHPELYSGKHKTTGLNVQVLGTLDGELAWISDPVNGARHDTYCLRESGALTADAAANWTGDKGYVGTGTLTPFKKPAHRDLLDWEKKFNTQINKIRYVIEQIIANFKTWRIMHTDYRRPLDTFATTIAAVVGLHFYRAA